MNDMKLKRELLAAAQRVVKSGQPDIEGFGLICSALGDLLGSWTGEKVRVLISADGQSEAIDMTKSHKVNKGLQ